MLESRFWVPLVASLVAAAVTTSGIAVIRRYEAWARGNATHFVCFAAGVLIGGALLHVVPKALSMSAAAPAFVLAGFVALYLFDRAVHTYVCENGSRAPGAMGLVPLVGIGFHSFLDGVIYSVTFAVSVVTGALAATGLVLHEFPEGVITYLLLVRSGLGAPQSFRRAFLAAGLSTPLGTLISLPFVAKISEAVLGNLLAIAAGALLYVGGTHLLPQADDAKSWYTIVSFGGGVLVAVIIVLISAH